MRIAITRAVSPEIARCELTHLGREPIDFERAQQQHDAYCECLQRLGCGVAVLGAEPEFPDSVFVEDVALVLDEIAVMTRPGAASRRGERESVEHELAKHREIARVGEPGTLDGGDVFVLGRVIYVGLSSRSNSAGIGALRDCVEPYGYTVRGLPVRGCLHLKSACTPIGTQAVLINRDWVDGSFIEGAELIEVHPSEPNGANALRIGESLVYDTAYPRTRELLEGRGYVVEGVDLSELAKAEGAVTCSSLVFSAR